MTGANRWTSLHFWTILMNDCLRRANLCPLHQKKPLKKVISRFRHHIRFKFAVRKEKKTGNPFSARPLSESESKEINVSQCKKNLPLVKPKINSLDTRPENVGRYWASPTHWISNQDSLGCIAESFFFFLSINRGISGSASCSIHFPCILQVTALSSANRKRTWPAHACLPPVLSRLRSHVSRCGWNRFRSYEFRCDWWEPNELVAGFSASRSTARLC